MSDNLQTKRIHLCLPGAAPGIEPTLIEIAPGTTANDVLAQMNLAGHYLTPAGQVVHLGGEEPLWNHVEDNAKVNATPRADVGAAVPARILTGKKPAAVVRARSVALWQIRGWRPDPKNSNLLRGSFRTSYGDLPGYIKLRGGDAGGNLPSFYMVTPPAALLAGKHGPCFRKRQEGVYWVHFNDRQMTVDSGIAAIEMQLGSCAKGGA